MHLQNLSKQLNYLVLFSIPSSGYSLCGVLHVLLRGFLWGSSVSSMHEAGLVMIRTLLHTLSDYSVCAGSGFFFLSKSTQYI